FPRRSHPQPCRRLPLIKNNAEVRETLPSGPGAWRSAFLRDAVQLSPRSPNAGKRKLLSKVLQTVVFIDRNAKAGVFRPPCAVAAAAGGRYACRISRLASFPRVSVASEKPPQNCLALD